MDIGHQSYSAALDSWGERLLLLHALEAAADGELSRREAAEVLLALVESEESNLERTPEFVRWLTMVSAKGMTGEHAPTFQEFYRDVSRKEQQHGQ